MNQEERLSLFNIDRIIIFLFIIFLLSGEAQQLLNSSGLRWAYLLLLAFGTSYIATPLAHLLAQRLGVVDIPESTKTSRGPTALLGGTAVYVAFALTILRNFSFSVELKGVALAGTLVFIVSLIDDRRKLPVHLKLVAQLAAVAVLIRFGVVISFLPEGLWGNLGEWVLTAVWIIGITNAIHFLDGMDGLAVGICGIMAVFFSLVGLQTNQAYMGYLALSLVGACLGFLPYNFRLRRPAAIFLGSAGSTFLGFMMAAMGVMGDWAGDHTVRLIVPVLNWR